MEKLKAEIRYLIEQRSWGELRTRLANWEVPEIIDIMRSLDKTERVVVFRLLSRAQGADVFAELEPPEQDHLLKDLANFETRQLLAHLDPDDRTALLEELPATVTKKLLGLLSQEDLHEARQLLGYPEESVGRLMTTDYVSISPDWTVGQALDHIRRHGRDSETINRVFITDKGGRLLDDIMLRRLILAGPEQTVERIMDRTFVSLSAFDDREEAVNFFKRYDIVAAPVVDSNGDLLGIVTVDDILDVEEEETTEDIQKSASVFPLKMSYLHATVWDLYRKRIGWLVALVLMNLVSGVVIAMFEEKLTAAIALIFFIPILLGSGGNTGSQSATLIIRALVTRDILPSQWALSLLKEMAVGLLLGTSLGLVSLVIGMLRGGLGLYGVQIGLVVGLSMTATVVVANIVGIVLPFALLRLRFDPAVASSPLITTIADASGLLIYFSIASSILGI